METLTEVKERPILFSAPMVRAILEGRKTQTRRVVSMQPTSFGPRNWWEPDFCFEGRAPSVAEYIKEAVKRCRYGVPGDRIYVKETFNVGWLDGGKVLYRADGGSAKECGYPKEPKWKSPLFMKRSESRLTLELADVRVERVQDISEAGAIAEGIHEFKLPNGPVYGYDPTGTPGKMVQDTAKDAFAMLWESINFKRGYGWNVNPWTWVIQFKKLESNL